MGLSYSSGGGGISEADGDVRYAQLAAQNTFTRGQIITQGAANQSVLASTGFSLTGSNAQGVVDLAGTWNTTGTPTALKLNITDTASNGSSLLMDLQKDSSSVFRVTKSGALFCSSNFEGASGIISSSAGGFFKVNGRFVLQASSDGVCQLNANDGASFSTLETLSLKTGAPAAGTAQFWKLGSTAAVSPTAPNRTVQIDVAGTVLYIHAKTTND